LEPKSIGIVPSLYLSLTFRYAHYVNEVPEALLRCGATPSETKSVLRCLLREYTDCKDRKESGNIAQQMAEIHDVCGDAHGTTTVTLYKGSEIHIHPVTGIAFLSKDDVLENPYQVKFSTEKGNSVPLLLLLFPPEWTLIVGQINLPNDERERRYYLQNAQ
jgi:hypothetical protein